MDLQDIFEPSLDLVLIHTGVAHDNNPPGRGSGRYAWGSGERAHQRDWDTYTRIHKLEKQGMKPKDIAAALGYESTGQLKAVKQLSSNQMKKDEFEFISTMLETENPDTGNNYTWTEIGKIMGINESSVRTKYKTGLKGNANKVTQVAETLKAAVDEKGLIDVGRGAELSIEGCSPDRMNTALEMLKQEGYFVDTVRFKQVTGGNQETVYKVLAKPGTTEQDIYNNRGDIRTIDDNGGTDRSLILKGEFDPVAIGLNRVDIRYSEDGGTDRDGMIEIAAHRDPKTGKLVPNAPDLSLGNAKYGQVRIAVDGGKECITDDNPTGMKYIKGMATYSLNVPAGKDILVNSNKSSAGGPAGALKDMKVGDQNPFGSSVVQTEFLNPKTGKPQPSAINLVGTGDDDAHKEGAWSGWSKNLPAQFLAKQDLGLVKQQLRLKSKQTEDELADIEKLNNPVVRRKILVSFGDQCDANAVSLKAAPIGGQGVKVLLPVPSLKDSECYCPSLENGTTVALVRFPHAGPFEIPICTVNNSNKEAKIFAGDGRDMIGINSHVAGKLSGADFDGDTAIVIPMTRKNSRGEFERSVNIKSAPSLPGLAGFDPTGEYGITNPRFKDQVDKKGKPTYHIMNDREKGIEMGVVSNLITDMYARGCDKPDELSRAVRYSMVVIDAKKHKLNYKQAYQDYDIDSLKRKYQSHPDGTYGGASSLLSRSKSEQQVNARAMWSSRDIDPATGRKIFKAPEKTTEADRRPVRVEAPSGYTWTDKSGKVHKGAKYMKDPETGKDIRATSTGKIVQDSSGQYIYQRGKGQELWTTVGYKQRMQKSTKMGEAQTKEDVYKLMSDHPNQIERAYADYAVHQKGLGNRARKEAYQIQMPKKDPVAAKKYATEVASLKVKLIDAKKYAPQERQAQLIANQVVNAAFKENPEMDADDRKKLRGQAIKAARKRMGIEPHMVTFTEKEWEAVNANAISPSMLTQLLDRADQDNYMQLAMPKESRISDAKKNRIQALYNAGWSYSEIANAVDGVSIGSIANIVSE